MAAATPEKAASIADDWQEIDAAASVRSLPSTDDEAHSEDESDTANLFLPTDSSAGTKEQSKAASAFTSPGPDERTLSHSSHDNANGNDSTTTGSDCPVPPLNTEAVFPVRNEAGAQPTISLSSVCSSDGESREDPRQRDPVFYNEVLGAAVQSLTETQKLLRGPLPFAITTPGQSGVVIASLLSQSMRLQPILAAYARHWASHGSGMAAGEIPVNADLLRWMNELLESLAVFQDDLRPHHLEVGAPLGGRSPGAWPLPIHDHINTLNRLDETMKDFFPILQVDFDTFCTTHMVFPASGRRSSNNREGPHPSMVRLRRELYNLRDQIEAVSRHLAVLTRSPSSVGVQRLSDALARLGRISGDITTALTNHGSEWIESDRFRARSGALSYRDFSALDCDVLHDITAHVRQFREQITIGGSGAENELGANAHMVRNHQRIMLMEGGQLQELHSILDFLQSLLQPGADLNEEALLSTSYCPPHT